MTAPRYPKSSLLNWGLCSLDTCTSHDQAVMKYKPPLSPLFMYSEAIPFHGLFPSRVPFLHNTSAAPHNNTSTVHLSCHSALRVLWTCQKPLLVLCLEMAIVLNRGHGGTCTETRRTEGGACCSVTRMSPHRGSLISHATRETTSTASACFFWPACPPCLFFSETETPAPLVLL